MLRRQRGISSGWLYLIAVIVVVALATWGLTTLYGAGVESGTTAEKQRWQARENAALAEATRKIKELQESYRALEKRRAEDVAAAAAQYEKDKANEVAKRDRVIADLRGGNLRLRVPVAACSQGGGSAVPGAPAGAGGRDGGASAELSGPASEFLVGLASEADAVVRQLAACQAVIAADRRK